MTNFSEDDLQRSEMYRANIQRNQQQAQFTDYREYLLSLEMKAEIKPFSSQYMSRIAQLTNKSNQFNLTTRRCSEAELTQIAGDPEYITLYGRLTDRFGDNGVVSVVFGHKAADAFHIDLWLMSCRVLKRDMEYAMLDELVSRCRSENIGTLKGYYYPTKKNKMVSDFFERMGFVKVSEDNEGNTVWDLDISGPYERKNTVITIEEA